jgi:TonB family protein
MKPHPTPPASAAARCLVRYAARQAPPELAQRLEEEWLADLAARPSAFARIRFGLGCCWATRVIAHEFGTAAVAAAGFASGQRLLVEWYGEDLSRFSRRTVALIAILCLHAGIFYLYLNGFRPSGVVERVLPMRAGVLRVTRRPPRPATLPAAKLTPISDLVVPPDFPRDLPTEPTGITAPHVRRPALAFLPARQPPIQRVVGGPGAGFPNTEDYYPAAARRLAEEGAAVVRVCVDASGQLTAAPTILESSGLARIDEGALRLAQAGSGHYRPTTENGRPVSACYPFLIRFRLQ